MVKDIRPFEDSVPFSLTNVSGTLFFLADDGNGYEVWVSDGTFAGTVMPKDVETVAAPCTMVILGQAGGKLIFSSDSDNSGLSEVWASDGTNAGTTMLKAADTLQCF